VGPATSGTRSQGSRAAGDRVGGQGVPPGKAMVRNPQGLREAQNSCVTVARFRAPAASRRRGASCRCSRIANAVDGQLLY
jgi:hypothetical protein